MPDADELEATRRLALLAFAKLSHYGSSPSSSPTADLPPLLSCCFQCLRRLDHADPDLAARCASHLRAFIHAVLSRGPDPSFVPALEVLFENLVDGNQLRSSYTLLDNDGAIQKGSRISTRAKVCPLALRADLELMSHHFISAMQDEEQFLDALDWSPAKATQRIPELGLAAAISLVRRSYSLSMPAIAQAHFVLLASRCAANGDLDLPLQGFQHAMSAYLMSLPALGIFDRTNAVKTPFSCYANMRLPNSCIPDTTNQKLNSQTNRLLSCCKAHSDAGLHLQEKDAFDNCMGFIEENQHMFPEQLRQKAAILVKRIVSNCLGCAKQKETHGLEANVSQEVIHLAAVLRLMGSSFLEILNCLRKMSTEDDMRHDNSILLGISEAIRLLGQYKANGLNRHGLFGISENSADWERPSMLMLFHFASLLVFCLRMQFGFLWKGCIIMIMMAMNLVIDEDRNLTAFQFLIASEKDSLNGSVWRKSSMSIASQFNKGDSSLGTPQGCKSADGRAFFEALFEAFPDCKQNSSELVDLVDFVDCKEGMDYGKWLKKHKKFKVYADAKWKKSKQPRKHVAKTREANKTERQKTSQ